MIKQQGLPKMDPEAFGKLMSSTGKDLELLQAFNLALVTGNIGQAKSVIAMAAFRKVGAYLGQPGRKRIMGYAF